MHGLAPPDPSECHEPVLEALRLLADSACAPVVVMDAEQRVVLFNGSAERLLGFQASEVVGRPCLTAIRCEQCMGTCPIFDEAPAQIIELHRKDGSKRRVERSGRPVRSPSGELIALVEVLRPTEDREALTAERGMFRTRDPVVSRLVSQVAAIARTDAPVLVVGAVGTGRTLMARAVHSASDGARGPTVEVHGAAPPADWREVWRRARGGTVILDEVTLLSPEDTARLLAGWPAPEADVRVVAVAGADIDALLEQGRFDTRLYYRLRGMRVDLPTLARRPEDIPFLFSLFLGEAADAMGRARPLVSPEALDLLCAHAWPGNVRELRSAAMTAAASAQGEVQPEDLPPDLTGERADAASQPPRNEAERIRWALEQSGGRIGEAAALLGTSRATFWRWRRQHGL